MPSFLDLPRAPNCESRSLVGWLDGVCYVIPLRCGSWGCIRCAARKTAIWARRVADAEPERMMTFTKVEETRADIKYTLQQIIRDLRVMDKELQYWGVLELHKSGKPHMHLLQKGNFIAKDNFKAVVEHHGWGHADIRACKTGFSAAYYCGKHLCHSHGRRWPGRLIRYSRKFFPRQEALADDKEATAEYDFKMVHGRADCLAARHRAKGVKVEMGKLGDDWVMGEAKIGDDVIKRYSRDWKKGYAEDHPNYLSDVQIIMEAAGYYDLVKQKQKALNLFYDDVKWG
jgi:hypothetical protein